MSKIKILGMGNENEFNYLIVKKDKNFFEFIENWVHKSFPDRYFSDISTYEDDKDNYKTKKKNVKDYEDTHEYYDIDEDLRIDAFFGKNKIFVTIYTPLKNREILMKSIKGFVEFKC